jgi:hypothetical protein
VAAGLLALSTGSALAAITPPSSARGLLLTRADLGRGWTVSGSAPARVPSITCHRLPGALRRAPSRAAASPTFAFGAAPLVQEDAYRYAGRATAGAVWGQVAQPALLSCLVTSLRAGAGQGVRFTITGRRQIAAPRLSVHARAYRVSATATYSGQSYPAYLDELVVNLPGAVSELTVASYEQPPTATLEARLGRIAARRGSR